MIYLFSGVGNDYITFTGPLTGQRSLSTPAGQPKRLVLLRIKTSSQTSGRIILRPLTILPQMCFWPMSPFPNGLARQRLKPPLHRSVAGLRRYLRHAHVSRSGSTRLRWTATGGTGAYGARLVSCIKMNRPEPPAFLSIWGNLLPRPQPAGSPSVWPSMLRVRRRMKAAHGRLSTTVSTVRHRGKGERR